MIRADLTGWALILIAMAVAYFVCLKASKEGVKLFKYGGYTIGVIILAISLSLIISDLARRRIRKVPPRQARPPATTSDAQRKMIPQLPPELQERLKQQQEQAK